MGYLEIVPLSVGSREGYRLPVKGCLGELEVCLLQFRLVCIAVSHEV